MGPLVVGRYVVYDEVASGGMATVHIGRLLGPVGFSRTVALKRLHPNLAKDPDFVAMFLDEARLAARIRHPNVVPTLDVVSLDAELMLVMDYVHGESIARLQKALRPEGGALEPRLAATIAAEMLLGLHAAHDAADERGEPLGIVHRDVSPQNVLVGVDGVSRVVDFGVAKAAGRLQSTRDGQIKGKASYMAPEQLRGDHVDRRTDVYAASVVLWEMLTGKRLFVADTQVGTMTNVLEKVVQPPSVHAPAVPPALDELVLRGLARFPAQRFQTAREMAEHLEETCGRVPSTKVGDWVERVAGAALAERAARVARIETESLAEVEASGRSSHASVADLPRPPETGSTEIDLSTLATLSSPRPDATERSLAPRRAWMLAAGAAVSALLVGLLASNMVGGRNTAEQPAVAAAAESPTPPAPSSAPASAPSVVPSSPTPAISPPRPVVSAAPPPSPRLESPPRPAPARPATASPVKSRAVSCTPAYTLDANGFRIPKPECL